MTGVQACALPISFRAHAARRAARAKGRLKVNRGEGSARRLIAADPVPDWNPRSFEVGPQPALGLVEADAAPHRIILDLILTDPRDAEIFGLRMADIEPRHRPGGPNSNMRSAKRGGGKER